MLVRDLEAWSLPVNEYTNEPTFRIGSRRACKSNNPASPVSEADLDLAARNTNFIFAHEGRSLYVPRGRASSGLRQSESAEIAACCTPNDMLLFRDVRCRLDAGQGQEVMDDEGRGSGDIEGCSGRDEVDGLL